MLTGKETTLIHNLNSIKLENCSMDCIALVVIQCISLLLQGFTLCKEQCDKLSKMVK